MELLEEDKNNGKGTSCRGEGVNGQVICGRCKREMERVHTLLFQTEGQTQHRGNREASRKDIQSAEAAEITLEEVRRSIARLKNGKAPGYVK